MAVINLTIENSMKDELLNDWKNGDVYLTVQYMEGIIGAKDITFSNATATTGGRKIEWIPSGTTGDNGSDFEIPAGTTITEMHLLKNRTQFEQGYSYAKVSIVDGKFTYGGIIRVDKVTITLT